MRIIISDIIKEQRKRLGVSQETLADEFGVSIQAVSKWENGISCPDITLLPAIADYFGVTIDYLLTGRAVASADDSSDGESEVPPAAVYTVAGESEITDKCPSPDTFYIVQIYNGHIISSVKNPVEPIKLELPNGVWNISVHAPASFGDVKGNISVSDGGEAGFNGDVRGPVNIADSSGSIGFNGDVNGDVTVNGGSFIGSGGVNGDIYVTGGDCRIEGDVTCEISVTGGSCKIDGDVTGDVIVTTGNAEVGGDLTGDISVMMGSLSVGGDATGDIAVNGGELGVNLTVMGDINAEGDVCVSNGSINCSGDANIEGDMSGVINCSGDVSIEGDLDGDIDCEGGDVNIEGDVNGNIFCEGGDVNVEGDARKISFGRRRKEKNDGAEDEDDE